MINRVRVQESEVQKYLYHRCDFTNLFFEYPQPSWFFIAAELELSYITMSQTKSVRPVNYSTSDQGVISSRASTLRLNFTLQF